MPQEPVLVMTSRGEIEWSNPDVHETLANEGVYVLSAFHLVMTSTTDVLVRQQILEGSIYGVERALPQVRFHMHDWLFGQDQQASQELQSLFGAMELRLRRDEPWYEIAAPLAAQHRLRVTWMWRHVCWVVDQQSMQVEASRQLALALESYLCRHETPLHWDYVIEIRHQYDREHQLEPPRWVYRPARLDDASVIQPRFVDPFTSEEG
jgi:hypothetical protein